MTKNLDNNDLAYIYNVGCHSLEVTLNDIYYPL